MSNGFRSRARRQLEALPWGRLGLQDLDAPLADIYQLGFIDGRASLAVRLAQAELDADRYYRFAFDHNGRGIPTQSFAELARRRGEPSRARAAEAELDRRLGSFAQLS